jgi:glycosyltransferase involved in cell wall biosynthesis
MGNQVTLYASGDSRTSAELVACSPSALRQLSQLKQCRDPLAHHMLMLERVFADAHEFDLIHFHTDILHFSMARRHAVPALTTLHGRLDAPELTPLFREFSDMRLASISNSQRSPLPWANWIGTVYHGLPDSLYGFYPYPGSYLAFVGRASPEKGLDRAIRISVAAGIPLKIAAKVDRQDEDYFKQQIEPLLTLPGIDFLGEVGDRQKNELIGGALAFLFPINWPEPFGLVMIESLACGTPVIAHRSGSVPEIIEHGKTGFIVDNDEEAIAACRRVQQLDRQACRAAFESRFSARRMAHDYMGLYERMVHGPDARHALEAFS